MRNRRHWDAQARIRAPSQSARHAKGLLSLVSHSLVSRPETRPSTPITPLVQFTYFEAYSTQLTRLYQAMKYMLILITIVLSFTNSLSRTSLYFSLKTSKQAAIVK